MAIRLGPDGRGRVYVVFCRLCNLADMAADRLAQTVFDFDRALTRALDAVKGAQRFKNPYGGAVVLDRVTEALDIARRLIQETTVIGIRVAVGLHVGPVTSTRDVLGETLIGSAMNKAARLAAVPEVEGRTAATNDFVKAAQDAFQHLRHDFFEERLPQTVKRTKLTYSLIIPAEFVQPPQALAVPDATVVYEPQEMYVVLYDLAGFSELEEEKQHERVERLTEVVRKTQATVGRNLRDDNAIWYAPAGDGGALIFQAHLGTLAWTFALALRNQAVRSGLDLHLGMHLGQMVVRHDDVPVGPAVLHADCASAKVPIGTLGVGQVFWDMLRLQDREGCQVKAVADASDILEVIPDQGLPPPKERSSLFLGWLSILSLVLLLGYLSWLLWFRPASNEGGRREWPEEDRPGIPRPTGMIPIRGNAPDPQQVKELQHALSKPLFSDKATEARRQQAEQALEAADLPRVDELLQAVKDKSMTAMTEPQQASTPQRLAVAAAHADLGKIRKIRLLYADAAHFYSEAARLAEPVSTKTQDVLATYLHEWADASYEAGDYAEAEEPLRRAITLREQCFTAEAPEVAVSYHLLAKLAFARGEYDQAETLLKKVHALRKQRGGKEGLEVADALHDLAELYNAQGHYGKAKDAFELTLSIRKRKLKDEHPDIASSLQGLAGVHIHLRQYSEAWDALQRAYAIRVKTLGDKHPQVASTLGAQALVQALQGQYGEAEKLLKQASDVWDHTFGPNHPASAALRNNLAMIYVHQGQYTKARELFEGAKRTLEQATLQKRPTFGTILNNLGMLAYLEGNYSQALSHLEQALQIVDLVLGKHHADVAQILSNLAVVYADQSDLSKAEELMFKAVQHWQAAFSDSHETMLLGWNNLGGLYQKQERYVEAEHLFQRALDLGQYLKLSKDHPALVQLALNIAITHLLQGRLEKAQATLPMALEHAVHILGSKHHAVILGYNNVSQMYLLQGDIERAREHYEKALALGKEVWAQGEKHPGLALIRLNWSVAEMGHTPEPETERRFREVLSQAVQTIGARQPLVAWSLALLSDGQQHDDLAARLMQQSLPPPQPCVTDAQPYIRFLADYYIALLKRLHRDADASQWIQCAQSVWWPNMGWLGIEMGPLDTERMTNARLDKLLYGVKVQKVEAGSPAARDGLAAGDIIVGLNGSIVPGPQVLRWLVVTTAPQTKVQVEIRRIESKYPDSTLQRQLLDVELGNYAEGRRKATRERALSKRLPAIDRPRLPQQEVPRVFNQKEMQERERESLNMR